MSALKSHAFGGEEQFNKSQWGYINYLVGANGTGKSLFAREIINKFNTDFLVRYLNAERLTGLEQPAHYFGGGGLSQGLNIRDFQNYKTYAEQVGISSSAFVILKERLDIRLKIETLLSDIFHKKIRLAEEGGYLIPKMQNIKAGAEYLLSQHECHGLKELITLLTFDIYS